jgi:formylglycine-generating enzyme required for sulfatase activity
LPENFVLIKGGTFMMGSPKSEVDRGSDETQHEVRVSDFAMCRYAVTQEEWRMVTGSNPSYFKGDNLPVENVNWDDCQAFINRLNQKTGRMYRLPTEAEWEYACRAGTITPFNTGENLTTDQANYNGDYPYHNYPKGECRGKTVPVDHFETNGYGLYNMHGNVWEWCGDWYGGYPSEPQVDPRGPAEGAYRVLRGGSWLDFGRYCRSAHRRRSGPGYRHGNGFRLARGQAASPGQAEAGEERPPGQPRGTRGEDESDVRG